MTPRLPGLAVLSLSLALSAGCHRPRPEHLAHPPVELQSWPDDNRQSRVVFITRNISERQVRGLLDALRKLI